MINVPELRKTLEFITANPEKHNQRHWFDNTNMATGTETVSVDRDSDYIFIVEPRHTEVLSEEAIWSCDTTGCLAGWAAMSAGWQPVRQFNGLAYRDGNIRSVSAIAQEVFGLSMHQAVMLFESDNTLHDLWFLAHIYTNGEIEIPGHVEASPKDNYEDVMEVW